MQLYEALLSSQTSPQMPKEFGRNEGGKVRLMACKEKGEIEVDTVTTLRSVPPEAWEYQLDTYSALE